MDFDPTTPIWLQLVAEFSRRIVTGQWAPDARIPGVRELAVDLGVNPNTVQRALAELERDGLARSERTAGRFVTTDAGRISALRRSLAAEAADDYARRARGFGMGEGDAVALLRERWSTDDRDDNTTKDGGGGRDGR